MCKTQLPVQGAISVATISITTTTTTKMPVLIQGNLNNKVRDSMAAARQTLALRPHNNA
jgi:hypothetical protein